MADEKEPPAASEPLPQVPPVVPLSPLPPPSVPPDAPTGTASSPTPPVGTDADSGYDVRRGLYEYYSSLAQAMLAQYENINQLLGPTDDWTAPGTLCEVLLRDLLRRSLPSMFSVDKGFIFGRRNKAGEEVHSPEIDILVHDTHLFRPVYRLEDFVIADPRAVRAVIQVKRSLSGPQLEEAIDNLVEARRHLRDCALPGGPLPTTVFSAALFFGDAVVPPKKGISDTYGNTIRKVIGGVEPEARPDFIGSLARRFYVPRKRRQEYSGFQSVRVETVQEKKGEKQVERNVALLVFLGFLSAYVMASGTQPPLYMPPGSNADETVSLSSPSPAAQNPEDT